MKTENYVNREVVQSGAFLSLPVSAQLLYFYLVIESENDGFVGNPKKVMQMIEAGESDLLRLIESQFVLAYGGGVIVLNRVPAYNGLLQ